MEPLFKVLVLLTKLALFLILGLGLVTNDVYVRCGKGMTRSLGDSGVRRCAWHVSYEWGAGYDYEWTGCRSWRVRRGRRVVAKRSA